MAHKQQERFLRHRQVTELTGLPTSTFYTMMVRNEFPQSISIGGRIVGWKLSEVQAWINARIADAARNPVVREPPPVKRFPVAPGPKRPRGRPKKIKAAEEAAEV